MEFDFSQNTTVDSIEKVPGDFRGLYKETEDGKFVLNSEDESVKSAVAAITRLNVALKASRAEAKAEKGKQVDLTPLSDFGDSPEGILASINAQLEEARSAGKQTDAAAMERQVAKIKEDLSKAHSTEMTGRDTRIEALTKQLYERLVQSEAQLALANVAVDIDLAMPFVERQIKVAEQDGAFIVTVVDDAGDIRYSGTTGKPLTIKELVEEMKGNTKFAPLFKSDAAPGGGTSPTGQGRPLLAKKPEEMSATEKISLGLRKHQHSSGRAAAAAGP